jgi:acyl-[acyl carrier protein]--UDP-N-acetylglucosamine O-acyltransferase
MEYLKFKNNSIHKTALINWKRVKIGKNNIIGPYVVIGSDAEYPGVKSNGIIKIGNNNTIREYLLNTFTNKY